MDDITDERRYYYVIFKKSKIKAWYMRFLHKSISHVLIARKSDGRQFWIITNYQGGNVLTNICEVCNIADIYPDCKIIKVWSKLNEKPSYRFWHFNCVEIVKMILGVRNCKVITPYQLYKYLKGAQHV